MIEKREIEVGIHDRDYFTWADIKVLMLNAEKQDGVQGKDLQFKFFPRYDMSGNPWYLYASYEADK